MSYDATMKFAANMSREEIEAKIAQLRPIAEGAGLSEVAQLLDGTAALAPPDLAKRLNRCLEVMNGADDYAFLIDQCDMLLLNAQKL